MTGPAAQPAGQTSVTFRELAAEPKVDSVGLSHLSLELGHLYMEDFAAGPDRLDTQFARVAPRARTAMAAVEHPATGSRPRISTCFLIDDYFTQLSSPAEVVPQLLAVAEKHGLAIDYLARESACAHADGVELAELVAARLTELPLPGANGSRPPVLKSGWLSNGQRSPDNGAEAMRRRDWAPAKEIGARNHSVFMDVELWHDRTQPRLYSCAFLAAVWQLLRLGVVRNNGANVVHPVPHDGGPFPATWAELPPITKLRANATPFCAYQTFSVLPKRFLQVEAAVRVVLAQTAIQQEVLDQLTERATRDGVDLPADIDDRIEYAFIRSS